MATYDPYKLIDQVRELLGTAPSCSVTMGPVPAAGARLSPVP